MKKLLKIVLLVMLLVVSLSLGRSVLSSYKKLGSLQTSQEEIGNLKKENQDLKNEVAYRKTSFYVEKQAREKLGLGKDNETVYVVENIATSAASEDQSASLPNWKKWMNLFF